MRFSRVVSVTTLNSGGSGVRLSSTLVLTCQHIVGRTARPKVDGVACVRVVAVDKKADLALLEVKPVEIEEAEWTEAVGVDTRLVIRSADGEKKVKIDATHADDDGVASLELPATLEHGVSGALAMLESDRLACAGLVGQGGEGAYRSVLIGAGRIRAFLQKQGVTLNMRAQPGQAPLQEYLRLMREETGWIDLRGLRIESGSAHSVPLEELYIPLHRTGGEAGMEERLGRSEKAPALETALGHRRVLIQGEAGSGKSTFLKRVAYELAGGAPGGFPSPLETGGLFPVFVKIAHLEKHMAKCRKPEAPTEEGHWEWLRHYLATKWPLTAEFWESKLQEAGTLVLLDGLDESPTMQTRLNTMRWIEGVAAKYTRCRFAVTTRPRAGVVLKGFHAERIAPLVREARQKFLQDWTRFLYRNQAPEKAEELRRKMSAALSARPEIDRMAENPLMLTALATLYNNDGRRLPEQRALLYKSVLEWLAEPPERAEGRTAAGDRLDWLAQLAYGMQTEKPGRVESLEKADAAALIRVLPKKEAEAFLDREEVDSGIVVADGKAVKFWHLSFQEFLAARYLNELPDEEQHQEVLRPERLYASEWREVVRLYAGLLSKKRVELLAGKILGETGPSLPERARTVALLSAIQGDRRPEGFSFANLGYRAMVLSMEELWESEATLEPWVRAVAAEALEEFPPHPKLRLPTEAEYWVRVAGFEMGRYPVTVFEWAAYVEACGERPPDWERQLAHPSRPVVSVTGHQAAAYAKWAKAKLPSDEQWKQAAYGGKRPYPWGKQAEPDKDMANYDSDVGSPTPVGIYPNGRTPEGLADLAGNVWEWTLSDNEYGKVVRGGCFYGGANRLRASDRGRVVPVNWNFNLGLRLLRE